MGYKAHYAQAIDIFSTIENKWLSFHSEDAAASFQRTMGYQVRLADHGYEFYL